MLLFLNFYYGDFHVDEFNVFSEVFKAVLAALLSIIGILLGINYEKSKEKKKLHHEQNLIFYSIYEDLIKIQDASVKLAQTFKDYNEEISKRPHDDVLFTKYLFIPELNRVINTEKNIVFSVLYRGIGDKKLSAEHYRNLFNIVEFINKIQADIYNRYGRLIEDLYVQKKDFKNGVSVIRELSSNILIDFERIKSVNFEEDKLYKTINTSLLNYFDFIKDKNPTIEEATKHLIIPLRDKLIDYNTEPKVLELLSKIKYNMYKYEDIINDSRNIGIMFSSAHDSIVDTNDKLKTLINDLSGIVGDFMSNQQ